MTRKPSVPNWARCLLCVSAAISMPAMLVAVAFGASVPACVAGAMMWYSLRTVKLAFEKD
jgi:hypothetical protein